MSRRRACRWPTGWPRCARRSRSPRAGWRCRRSARARALLAKAGAREALGDATVVALAGATGSGKSTLFNALSGGEVSTPGVRRPTTGVAHATVWGDRTARTGCSTGWRCRAGTGTRPEPALDGLVLLDLPDHDSVRLEHRLEVDRLVELVDVLVWVLDPQKYADAAVHDRYLAPLAGHAGVLLVVLNQVDRLDAGRREGLPGRPARRCSTARAWRRRRCWRSSARTGAGLGRAARRAGPAGGRPAGGHRPAHRRRPRRGGRRWRRTARDAGARGRPPDAGELAERPRRRARRRRRGAGGRRRRRALGRPRTATARTGWPLLRWTRKLRPDPLARLHLGRRAGAHLAARRPAPCELAGRRARRCAGPATPPARGCRRPGGTTCAAPSRCAEDRLADRLDRAVAGTDLGPDRVPLWQRGGRRPAVAAGAGRAGRRAVAAGARRPRLASSSTTSSRCRGSRGSRCPTLLLVGGLLAGALLALVARPLVRLRARRRAPGGRPPAARRGRRRGRGRSCSAPMADVREDAARFRAAVEAGRAPLVPVDAGGAGLGQLVALAARCPRCGRRAAAPTRACARAASPSRSRSRAGRPGAGPSRRARGRGRRRGPAAGRAPRRSGRAASRRVRRPPGRARRRRRAAARWRPAPRRPAAGRRGRPRSRPRRPTGARCGRGGRCGRGRRRAWPPAASARRRRGRRGRARTATRRGPARRPCRRPSPPPRVRSAGGTGSGPAGSILTDARPAREGGRVPGVPTRAHCRAWRSCCASSAASCWSTAR